MAKNEVAAQSNALPAHLQQYSKQSFGNIDQSDLVIPRVKLLQALSPELDEYDDAKKGTFWHNVANQNLGPTLLGIPLFVRKSYVLWAPRNDDRGILARARDGIHWDVPEGTEFTVRPKGSPADVTYRLGKTVGNLGEFGSGIPGDPQSRPAASLTYETLWLFPEFLELGPAIVLNTRSGVKPMKDLISKVEMKPTPSYTQLYRLSVVTQRSDDGDFYNYKYTSEGYADEESCKLAFGLYEKYKDLAFRANDEREEDTGDGPSRRAPVDTSFKEGEQTF